MKKFRNYKNYKYDITREGNKTIATATYAGVPVQAHAKLDPQDVDTPELAAELAKARCNEKICKKRVVHAKKRRDEAYVEMLKAIHNYNKMVDYVNASNQAYSAAKSSVKSIEDKI